MSARPPAWQFWIDRGGTFTDVVAVGPDGQLASLKLLSENPAQYPDAAIAGIERLLADVAPPGATIAAVKMGTTVATNALLERGGGRVVLVTTAGFGDALRIGTQQRPDIFALDIRLPGMLYADVVEANERVAANGEVVTPLDETALARDLEAARARGFDGVAIAFMHGYRHAAHERRAAAIAARLGFAQVSTSHEVSPLIKLVERGQTTVADAYLTPVLRDYVERVRSRLAADFGDPALLFMQSHGGLVTAAGFRGVNAILSGPAGGVVGMAATAATAGCEAVIGFDMGGTSTDVAMHVGEFERATQTIIGGVRIAAPMLRINTVAAGGGSILRYEGGRPRVGPESAGADPGPACYRNGGPLTLTDANVLLGRIQPDFFPHVFGPDGDEPIDAAVVAERFAALAREVATDGERSFDPAELAAGFLRIGVDHMATAIEQITVQRGHDVGRFALACFGGAGGQHACDVADALGIEKILIDPLAGVLSAYGIGVAEIRSIRAQAIEHALDDESMQAASLHARRLARELGAELARSDAPPERVAFEYRAFLRVPGSDTLLPVPFLPFAPALPRRPRGVRASSKAATGPNAPNAPNAPSAPSAPNAPTSSHAARSLAATIAALFASIYRQRFGFDPETDAPILESIEVEAVAAMRRPRRPPVAPGDAPPAPIAERRTWLGGGWCDAPVYARAELGSGAIIEGPAIIVEDNSTTVVEVDWRVEVDGAGILVLTRRVPKRRRESVATARDPVMLEVFNNQFMHVAEQMGTVLEQTAHSVNIKERLDYSCALFDGAGRLVANAPHMPVHLGSMGETVRTVLAAAPEMQRGDAYALNAPYAGGTHLPDITVVSPVFVAGESRPAFLVASRAHHADVGGITPGSMPATSRNIDEEGVVFGCTPIVSAGRFLERDVRALLASSPYPARNPDQNVADLKAQLAANAKGSDELERMLARFGRDVVGAYMAHVQANAEECVRRAIRKLRDGQWTVELDGGERVQVAVRVDRDSGAAVVDFAGTSPMSAGNYNAPSAIARAAVVYVFRTLIDEDIPLNEGCLAPLRIVVPRGCLLDPQPPAAVVAGNVETSQCITDALLAALGVLAASQGTMNNFTFGDAEHQYYETLCGGCGAGDGFDGASAVHSHMTNSRLTDPEVLEQRFPVRLRRFEIRHGSGGAGRSRGGDGVVRELEFLVPLEGSILSNRRRTVPFGLAGGGDGKPGRNVIVRASGRIEELPAAAEMEFGVGDRFVIETPGGGGYGAG